MGATDTSKYTERQQELSALFKALAHPARIAIIEYLANVNTCICGDIVDELPLAQPTVSQHLKELKSAGLIKGDITGNSVCYCLDQRQWRQLKKMIDHLYKKLEAGGCVC